MPPPKRGESNGFLSHILWGIGIPLIREEKLIQGTGNSYLGVQNLRNLEPHDVFFQFYLSELKTYGNTRNRKNFKRDHHQKK